MDASSDYSVHLHTNFVTALFTGQSQHGFTDNRTRIHGVNGLRPCDRFSKSYAVRLFTVYYVHIVCPPPPPTRFDDDAIFKGNSFLALESVDSAFVRYLDCYWCCHAYVAAFVVQ